MQFLPQYPAILNLFGFGRCAVPDFEDDRPQGWEVAVGADHGETETHLVAIARSPSQPRITFLLGLAHIRPKADADFASSWLLEPLQEFIAQVSPDILVTDANGCGVDRSFQIAHEFGQKMTVLRVRFNAAPPRKSPPNLKSAGTQERGSVIVVHPESLVRDFFNAIDHGLFKVPRGFYRKQEFPEFVAHHSSYRVQTGARAPRFQKSRTIPAHFMDCHLMARFGFNTLDGVSA